MVIQTLQYYCVIAAAGSGQRMGSHCPKQYLSIEGKTILEWSLQPFLKIPEIEQVVVVIAQDDHRFFSLPIAHHPKLLVVHGGHERYHSVLAGLAEIAKQASDNDWVMVHDAARPNIAVEDIYHLIKTVGQHPVGGILGTPISDSLKQVNQQLTLLADAPREHIWRAFTPQIFRLGLLENCLEEAVQSGDPITDESSAVLRKGHEVMMIEGRSDNIKVTTPADYWIMNKLITAALSEQDSFDEARLQ